MNKIISFVMVGTNDLEKSSKFYDAIFVHLGLKKVSTSEKMIAYAHSNDPHEVKFYITKPQNVYIIYITHAIVPSWAE